MIVFLPPDCIAKKSPPVVVEKEKEDIAGQGLDNLVITAAKVHLAKNLFILLSMLSSSCPCSFLSPSHFPLPLFSRDSFIFCFLAFFIYSFSVSLSGTDVIWCLCPRAYYHFVPTKTQHTFIGI